VGRNVTAGNRIVEELKATNKNGTYIFLSADVSKLKTIDEVCQKVETREKYLDLLFMSPGSIALKKQGDYHSKFNTVQILTRW
jgi:NADP-dependent 3-hydroxy acid dehydrogenase YdfG